MLSLKQKILSLFYPIILIFTRLSPSKGFSRWNEKEINPHASIYAIVLKDIHQNELNLQDLKGKLVLIVNIASHCGYTAQDASLEKIHNKPPYHAYVLGFPANDFNNQEPGTEEEIEKFCKINYNITFPLFQKSSTKKPHQNPLYAWLTDPSKNGWNNQEPTWNYYKYLIDEHGKLIGVFGPAHSPLKIMRDFINRKQV